MAQYRVAMVGGNIMVTSPVPIIQDLIPVGQTNQRPGLAMWLPYKWIQHETANTNPGANAEMHSRWLHGGADGGQVSFHFCGDDHEIRQFIPIGEVTWQAADGAGPGNFQCISFELCVNSDGDFTKAWHNAADFCGGVMKALKRPASDIGRHWDYNYGECCSRPCDVQCGDRHHCPDQLMSRGLWPQFVSRAAKVIAGGTPVPNPDPNAPEVYAPGVDSELCKTWFGTVYAGGRSFSFDPDGPVSAVWLANGLETGEFPQLISVTFFEDSPTQRREYFRFDGGLVIFRATGEEARVLTKAAA